MPDLTIEFYWYCHDCGWNAYCDGDEIVVRDAEPEVSFEEYTCPKCGSYNTENIRHGV
jgi:predicted RNA-binding Zn-ribbon protein involved in translation (DUF1610 family)